MFPKNDHNRKKNFLPSISLITISLCLCYIFSESYNNFESYPSKRFHFPNKCSMLSTKPLGNTGKWEGMWSAGIAKGQAFDCGICCPALSSLIEGEEPPLPSPPGDALVPGCGRGYDAIRLAEAGYTVLGVELAPTAVESANQYLEEVGGIKNEQGSVTFQEGNFFDISQQFDVIFDYTFLCALPPEIHEQWANQMKSLLKPDGELITLIFPICEKEGGPPYKMSIDYVKSLCEGAGFESFQLERLPSELCNERRDGGSTSMFGAHSAIGRWRHRQS